MRKCDCHEWHDLAEIGDWVQGNAGGLLDARPVRKIVATDDIWAPGRRRGSDMTREALTAAIRNAGGIDCANALQAFTYQEGCIVLEDGVHRWAVATELAAELGIERAPVAMDRNPPCEDPASEWLS